MDFDPVNVEVFFEAVELENVGEFERADVAVTGTNFLLQITHDTPELLRSEAAAQELKPEPLTIIAQGKLLASEVAVEVMDVLYGSDDFVVRQERLAQACVLFQRAMAVSQGSRSRAFWTWTALIEALAADAASSRARWAE